MIQIFRKWKPVSSSGSRRLSSTRQTVVALASLTSIAHASHGQWIPNYQHYSIQRLGLTTPEYTNSVGQHYAAIGMRDAQGRIAGISDRYSATGAYNGSDAWVWDGMSTIKMGLSDAAHTGSSGLRYSYPTHLHDSGNVLGVSHRIKNANTSNGVSLWVWNGITTVEVGLIGNQHTTSTGFRHSTWSGTGSTGPICGVSSRYGGPSAANGNDAWIWDGSASVQIGFTGGPYTDASGFQTSIITHTFADGRVVGYSNRYDDFIRDNGRDIWIWNGTTTVQLGLTGPGYVNPSTGYQYSGISSVNTAGHILGYSTRPVAPSGRDVWIWDGSSHHVIGLEGLPYTRPDGYSYAEGRSMNLTGQASGISSRFSASGSDIGQDAWITIDGVAVQVGLTAAAHTGTTGYRSSTPAVLNDAGKLTGYSNRYVGTNTSNGTDAWYWDGESTTQIGLTGPGYTSSSGFQHSTYERLLANGQATGFSNRYLEGGANLGRDMWVWKGGTTIPIGLSGGINTRVDGYQHNALSLQNAAGVTVGYANRYSGMDNAAGQDAWYFDPANNNTVAIVASVRLSDGYAFSQGVSVTADGYLLGYYTHFADGIGSGEDRAFVFRPDLGLIDLGELAEDGLATAGWAALTHPKFSTPQMSQIVGHGRISGQVSGQSAFVLIAARGACCNGVTCSITDHTNCVAPGTRFAGNGAACNPPGNSTIPCCLANFDQSDSGVTIDDLFQYLNAWFLSSPRADADQSDSITIDDLLIYLNTWFTGC